MNVLVVGSGGREHALAWGLARSPRVARVWVSPGNGGTDWPAGEGRAPCAGVPAGDPVEQARSLEAGLVVVGPEAPLAEGLADRLEAAGLPVFGPTRAAARLETSKAFARTFMAEHGLPTPEFAVCTTVEEVRRFAGGRPAVVKADGLAAGKGVLVCDDGAEVEAAARDLLGGSLGEAGRTLVVEERLHGPEVSVLAFCDGRRLAVLPPARDHKRLQDGDRGPNTGGMGAVAPAPGVGPDLLDQVSRTIMEPALRGLEARGTPYRGLLYAGLMLTDRGPQVLEFNCRFGDPEAQALLPLLESDLYEFMAGCAAARLPEGPLRVAPGACAAVVAASPGYPGPGPTGLPVEGLDRVEGALVFHAGTARREGRVVTAGGRVLAVSALGATVDEAVDRAYRAMENVRFEGMQFRRDIGRTGAAAR